MEESGFKPKLSGCRSCFPNICDSCQSVHSNKCCVDSERKLKMVTSSEKGGVLNMLKAKGA